MNCTISHDTAYYARRPQQSSRINRQTEPKQPPRSNNRPTHSQQSNSSKHGRDYYQTHRMHNHDTEPVRNYTMGHPPPTQAQAHVGAADEEYTIHRHRGKGFSVRTRRNVMVHPTFFYPSHHIFNLQKPSLHWSPLVKATFTVKRITFFDEAMLDWMLHMHRTNLPTVERSQEIRDPFWCPYKKN